MKTVIITSHQIWRQIKCSKRWLACLGRTELEPVMFRSTIFRCRHSNWATNSLFLVLVLGYCIPNLVRFQLVDIKLLQAQGFKSLKGGLTSNLVGQVVENDRTRMPWSLFKKIYSMLGILQNRKGSRELFMGVVLAVELGWICVNETQRYGNSQRLKRKDF